MSKKAIVFELRGRFAHFKVPETTRGAISFPFPPRTALLGMIAGILGYPRNSYWKEGHPLREARIALEIVNPLKMYPMKVNYTQTKSDFVFKVDGLKILIPSDPVDPSRRGFTTQFRLDLVQDPCYRVYFSLDDRELFDALAEALKGHQYKYVPYLGHANLLAEIEMISVVDYELAPIGEHEVSGLVPLSTVKVDADSFIAGDFHIVHGVPMSMRVIDEPESLDGRYLAFTEVDMLDSIAFQVEPRTSPVRLILKTEDQVAELTVGGIHKKVVFLPGAH